MHQPNVEEGRPTDLEVKAAARELHAWGKEHGWWPPSVTTFDALDPVGREELEAVVERVLMAAAAAKSG